MTRLGELFALPTPELVINAPAFSSLPTPTANEDSYRLQGNSQQSNCLAAMAIRGEIAMLPTPAVNDMGDGKTLEW